MRRVAPMFPRLLLFGVLLALSLYGRQPTSKACAEYHDTRIQYLMGCCGDQPIAEYPGPTLPDSMGAAERATRALLEIHTARKSRCYEAGSTGAKELKVNEINALLMRAQARSRSASQADLQSAVRDAELAARRLRAFVAAHPESAVRIWYEVAMALRHCGRTWDALAFVAGLPPSCCAVGQKEAFLGDLYYELGIFDVASEHYSAWLKEAPSTCGYDESVRNAAELRGRGFQIPPVPQRFGEVCVSLKWHPTYIWIPENRNQ